MEASNTLIARLGAGTIALLIAADAMVRVISSQPPAESPSPLAAVSAAADGDPLAPRPQWVVKVDGWTLGLDDVEAGYLTALLQSLDNEIDGRPQQGPYPYLDLIIRTASAEEVDWRLIVAIIAEESGFDPRAVSPAGAYGLMQVMPIAAREVEADRYRAPAANVRTGIRYLKRMMNLFAGAEAPQRLALALAAYNMGPAHLADAQSLARRYGVNPMRWDDGLNRVLPLLEVPAIYAKLPNGFARGRTTVGYVERVRNRYDRLRRQHALTAPADAAAKS